MLRFLTGGSLAAACFCRRCLSALARQALNADDPAKILALVREEVAAAADSKDLYLDQPGRVVFTAGHHCGSGCRNCPYTTSSKGTKHPAFVTKPADAA